jgi:hypothetical protein
MFLMGEVICSLSPSLFAASIWPSALTYDLSVTCVDASVHFFIAMPWRGADQLVQIGEVIYVDALIHLFGTSQHRPLQPQKQNDGSEA